MKRADIHNGFIFTFRDYVGRTTCFDGEIEVNGIETWEIKPVEITNETIELLGLKFYNGWYFRDVLFTREQDHYVVTIHGFEVPNKTIHYIHEIQAVIYAIYGIIV